MKSYVLDSFLLKSNTGKFQRQFFLGTVKCGPKQAPNSKCSLFYSRISEVGIKIMETE